MPDYLVQWEIHLAADSPREATEQAWAHMRRPDSTANVFTLTDEDGDDTEVDLMEEES